MKRGEIVEGFVQQVDFPNRGIVETAGGERLSVKGVLPGQRISCVVQKTGKGKAKGRLLEVLEAAENELAEPVCVCAKECGGCSYQTLSYEDQLALKERQVHDLLVPVIGEQVWQRTFSDILPSPLTCAYRNKMEFSFGDREKGGALALGMHKKGSLYDIVTADECRIIDADMRRVLAATLQYFRDAGATFYHKMRHSGYLRHLLVRKACHTGELLVDLITSTDKNFAPGQSEAELLRGWCETLLAMEWEGTPVGILHTVNDRTADVVEDQGTEILYGRDYFYEELLGLRFRISPFSFFQTNSRGAELLYDTARKFICEDGDGLLRGRTVYDLYSGTGTIAQILAPVAGKVIGVEIVEEAVDAARKNAQRNGLDNCEFIAGDVLKVLDSIREKPDFIVLDPPRDGIHPKALKKIVDYGVDSLIYISCKPTSLARDLEVFLARGYQVKRLCCVDMFPGNPNVETVVLIQRKDM